MRTRQKVKIRKSTRYFYIICIMSLIIVLSSSLIQNLLKNNTIKKTKISLLQALNNEANRFVEKGKKNDMEYFHFLGKFLVFLHYYRHFNYLIVC